MRPHTLAFLTVGLLAAGLAPRSVQAGLPLPDQVIYGTIAISNRPVTSANTDVVIEARRALNSPVVASYTMGSTPRLGTYYYELRLQFEDSSPSAPQVISPGEQLVITVRNASGVQFAVTNQVTQGNLVRLDFGSSVDADGDGVPDGWELANLGNTSADMSRDTDGDGVPDGHEYIAGTGPKDPSDFFQLALLRTNNEVQVSFRALAASGIGYEGKQRFYALESTPNLATGPWETLSNMSRIPGNNQLIVYSEPVGGTNVPSFFRARVWLEGQ